MIGKVIGVEENIVYVELNEETIEKGDLIHKYVCFKHEEKTIVGEIINVKEKIANYWRQNVFISKTIFKQCKRDNTTNVRTK